MIRTFLILMLFCQSVQAVDFLVKNNSVTTNISHKFINRIEVKHDRIAQVVGNQDEYIIDSDAESGQIFLTPRIKTGKKLQINLITELGKIIDMNLEVKDIGAQSISMSFEQDNMSKAISSYEYDENQEIIELLRNLKKLEFKKLKKFYCFKNAYEFQNDYYRIIKTEIKNETDKEIVLKEQDYANCMKDILAIRIDKQMLVPKESTNLYLIGRK